VLVIGPTSRRTPPPPDWGGRSSSRAIDRKNPTFEPPPRAATG